MQSTPSKSMLILGDRMYVALKWLAQIGLPAAGTLYASLAPVWNFPNVDKVTLTILSVDTFLGVLLGISSASYNRSPSKFHGQLNVLETEENLTYELDVNVHPEELRDHPQVILKVNDPARNK